MGVTLGDDADELGPRVEVGAVPFSVRAGAALYADEAGECVSLAGFDPADYLRVDADIDADTFAGRPVEDFELAGIADDLIDDALAVHAADPDAHHSSTSDGLDLTPSSVTIGSTAITEGEIDFGDGADDTLTAAMVETLIGGGNADALHTHAGSGGGGSCYTAWGRSSCVDGWTRAYQGYAAGNLFFATESPNERWGMAAAADTLCVDVTAMEWSDVRFPTTVEPRPPRMMAVGRYETQTVGSTNYIVASAGTVPAGEVGLSCAVCCR
jgi:hypothetical protein